MLATTTPTIPVSSVCTQPTCDHDPAWTLWSVWFLVGSPARRAATAQLGGVSKQALYPKDNSSSTMQSVFDKHVKQAPSRYEVGCVDTYKRNLDFVTQFPNPRDVMVKSYTKIARFIIPSHNTGPTTQWNHHHEFELGRTDVVESLRSFEDSLESSKLRRRAIFHMTTKTHCMLSEHMHVIESIMM